MVEIFSSGWYPGERPPPSDTYETTTTCLRSQLTSHDDTIEKTDTTQENKRREFSYSARLKAVNESHYNDATQECSYLPNEKVVAPPNTISIEEGSSSDDIIYQSHPTPVLTEETVAALRSAAQNYFEDRGENWGLRDVALQDLLSEGGAGATWKQDVDDSITQFTFVSIVF